MTDDRLRLHATCDAGLEEVLKDELDTMGADRCRIVPRGVRFNGDMELLWRANLECRVANRILLELSWFPANTREQLYQGAQAVNWGSWMTPFQTIAIDSRTSNTEGLRQSMFVNQVVKDAICDRFRRETNRRPDVERNNPDIPITVHVNNGRATLLLDSSGDRLHKRGYRMQTGEAPLRETLAAGLLRIAGWDGTTPLLDPMCGSGTIVIEGALIALNIAPGLLRVDQGRSFAFQKWRTHQKRAYRRLVSTLRDAVKSDIDIQIIGSDHDRKLVGRARRNAQTAGIYDSVQIRQADLAEAPLPGPEGTIVTNPPYGERLGAGDDLEALYKHMGDSFKQKFSGYTAWVIAGERALANVIGLRASRRHPIFNGAIECRFLRFDLYKGSREDEKNED